MANKPNQVIFERVYRCPNVPINCNIDNVLVVETYVIVLASSRKASSDMVRSFISFAATTRPLKRPLCTV